MRTWRLRAARELYESEQPTTGQHHMGKPVPGGGTSSMWHSWPKVRHRVQAGRKPSHFFLVSRHVSQAVRVLTPRLEVVVAVGETAVEVVEGIERQSALEEVEVDDNVGCGQLGSDPPPIPTPASISPTPTPISPTPTPTPRSPPPVDDDDDVVVVKIPSSSCDS